MEQLPTTEQHENLESSDSSSSLKRIKRRIGNRLILGLALGAGLFAATGASAEDAASRFRETAQSTRTAISERVREVDEKKQEIIRAEREFVRLSRELESVREEAGLTTHLVGYSITKSWHPTSAPSITFKKGKTLQFEQYVASPETPDSVRELIAQHDAATEHLANLELSLI